MGGATEANAQQPSAAFTAGEKWQLPGTGFLWMGKREFSKTE